ncbi:MAG: GntR family transcriptional regulator [Sphaerochaetaceae bacterium]
MADYRTESQKISDAVREAIISGEYKPGQRLPQRKIAERFKSTTIVVREALRHLETEHLVIIEPRFGAMVQEATPRNIKERYYVREALEGMAARLAAENMNDQSRSLLYDIARKCDELLVSKLIGTKEKAELHQRFHLAVLEIADCEELNKLLRNIYLNSMILSNAYRIDWSADIPLAHTNLVNALVGGDPDIAEKAMRQHVRNGRDMELNGMGKTQKEIESN